MTIDFYYVPGSAPCRAVMLTAIALGVELNYKLTDLMEGKQFEPEFLKLNPLHTVPTIVDGDLCLSESRVIMAYLVNKYGKTDALYPRDPKKRAMVDQRLYFEVIALYPQLTDYYFPVFFENSTLNKAAIPKIHKVLKMIENFLTENTFIAGSTLTIADLSLVAYISSLDELDFDMSQYQHILKWYKKVKETAPGYEEANGKNVLIFKKMVHDLSKGRT